MAIKDAFTDNWDAAHPEAHVKVNKTNEDWVALSLTLDYFVYKDAAQAAGKKPPISQGSLTATKATAPAYLKQAAVAYRAALTQFLKEQLFSTGEVVADADRQGVLLCDWAFTRGAGRPLAWSGRVMRAS